MISSNLDYPLKAPSPDTVPLGVRASTYPLWGDMNIQFVDFPTSVNNHGPVFAHWREMEGVVVAGCVKKGISPPGLHLVRGCKLVVSHPLPLSAALAFARAGQTLARKGIASFSHRLLVRDGSGPILIAYYFPTNRNRHDTLY